MNNITKLKVGDTVSVKCKVEAVFTNSQMVMVTTKDCDKGFDAYADELEDCSNTDCLNYVLDKIRAEVTSIAINGQVDEHTVFIRTGEQVKQMVLEIIDKYMAEGARNDSNNDCIG